MNTIVNLDEGQRWLISCLTASLEPDLDRRSAAEEALKQASVQQGYGVALAKVTVNKDVQLGLRQLAAVLLKQFVKQHWQEGDKHYLPPTASPEDKAAIRCLLPPALEDPHGKIRTAVGMAIASIAVHDWPQEWPDLMHFLIACISAQGDTNRVHGALRCLSLFASDLDDAQLPSLVPVLFPVLHRIISSHEYDPGMRRRALIILHNCIATLGVMSGVYQSETRNLMAPMLKPWMDQFAHMLSPPVPAEDPEDWSLRAETLKCLLHIVHNFSKLASTELPVVLGPLWQTVVSGLKIYESSCIQGVQESFANLADSDGSDQSLETLIIQLFEFLLALVGSPRFSKVVQEHIGDLVYYTIGYMQMTEEQVQTWSTDPNQYVADEDDVTYSCRVSGILLLEELVVTFEDQALNLIFDVVKRRIDEASKAKALGQRDWWKLREASILAFGCVADSLIDAQEKGSGAFQLEAFLESILVEDLSAGMELCPFLHGRGLWAAAKFASLINTGRCQQFLFAAMEGLNAEVPAPIKVGSCRALSELFPRVDSAVLRPHLGSVFSALGKLLLEASDETLHLVLETMQSAVNADEQASAAVEPTISPLVLNIWAQNVHDPLIGIDALEILEAIRDVPGCREPLTHRVLPFLATIFANPRPQAEGLVAGALDLLTMLLKNAPPDLVRAVHDATYAAVCNLIMRSDDHAELQNGSECLAAIVKGGGEALLEWSGDPHHSMKLLLDAAARLLHPDLDDSASLFVGSFITSLVMQLSTQMAPHVRELISALVARLETAQIMGLKSSLLLVFARLVHVSAPNVAQFIDLLLNVPAKGFDNALAFVMTEWIKHQGDIQGAYQIKVSTIALALLLASGHPQLANIYVQGRLMKTASSRIITRSRAKTAPDQWTSVPLPPKLLSLLADVLVEMQEQNGVGMVDDTEWEDAEEESDEELEAPQWATSRPTTATSVFQPLEDMEHLLNEEVEEGDYIDDAYAATDPINQGSYNWGLTNSKQALQVATLGNQWARKFWIRQINLSAYLVDFIKQFAERDRASFESLCQELSEGEKIAVQSALAR